MPAYVAGDDADVVDGLATAFAVQALDGDVAARIDMDPVVLPIHLWGANSYSPPIVHWIGIRTPQVGRSTAASADTISRYASFPSSAAPRFPDRPARPIRTAASESRTPRCRACPPAPHPLAGGPARRLRKPLRSPPARKCTTPSTPWRSLLSYSFRNCCTAKTITPPTAVIKIHFAPMRRAFAKSFLCRRYADSQTSFDSRRAS